jgi:hypothetical protein
VARDLTRHFNARHQVNFGFDTNNSTLLADVDALAAWGIDVDSLASAAAAVIQQRDGVARVFTPATLRSASPGDSAAMLWRRQMPAGFGWLALGVAHPGYVFNTGSQADHGTMSVHSRSVPIVFLVPGVAAARVNDTAETVDIAPTLAALLGVAPLQRPDGRVLPQVRR